MKFCFRRRTGFVRSSEDRHKVRELLNHIIGVLHLSEAVGRMAEGNPSLLRGGPVALDIAHIDRIVKMIPFHDKPDIGAFGTVGIARTFKICDIRAKPCFFEEKLNISVLTIAYDKKLIVFRKLFDRVCHTGIEEILFCLVQIFVFLIAADIDERITVPFLQKWEGKVCDVTKRAPEKLGKLVCGKTH